MKGPNRKWWVLVGTSFGLFLLMLDSTVVGLALPSIQGDLDATEDELQWVLSIYLLVIAVLVVTAGRFGDIFGRRRVFVVGIAVFGVGSVVAAAAPSPEVLIGARVVMAAGGAAMLPLSLALVIHSFPTAEQARAIGIWTAVSAIALGLGPLVGGALADIDWRLIFAINIPIAALGVVVTRAAADEIRDETATTRIDWIGLGLLSLGLLLAVFGLVKSNNWGWASPETIATICGGLLLLALFAWVETRVSDPIVELGLFRNRPYLGATAAAFGVVAAYWSLMFFEPQYLQNILDYSPVVAGVLILPVTVPMIVISPSSGLLIRTFGARMTMTAGLISGVAGLVVLTRISATSGYGLLFPGLLLVGISFALVYAPMSTAAMQAMPKAKAGIASAGLAMNRILAGAIGLALVGAVFQSLLQERLDDELADGGLDLDRGEREQLEGLLAGSQKARDSIPGDPPGVAATIHSAAAEAYSFALGNALWILVGIMAACTVLTWILVEPRQPTTEVPEAARHPDHQRHHAGRLHL